MRGNVFNVVSDPDRIRERLDAYMQRPAEQPSPFVPGIRVRAGSEWNGRTTPSPHHIEGALPMAAHQDKEGNRTYTLTNSDSKYTRAIGTVRLADIEYIEEL